VWRRVYARECSPTPTTGARGCARSAGWRAAFREHAFEIDRGAPPGKPDAIVKTLIIGDSGVGKTAFLHRFADGQDVTDAPFIATIGVDFKICTVRFRRKVLKLQMWDTAGQERFHTITSAYYRGCDAIFLGFDFCDRTTFDRLDHWRKQIERHACTTVAVVLVGLKTDMRRARLEEWTRNEVGDGNDTVPPPVVTTEEAAAYAGLHALPYVECSARTGENSDAVVSAGLREILRKEPGRFSRAPSAPARVEARRDRAGALACLVS